MAIATGTLIAAGAAAAAGGIAGAIPKTSTQSVNAGAPTDRENNALDIQDQNFGDLQKLVGAGPGTQDVQNSLGASTDLANMLDQYSKSGGLPSGADTDQARNFASQIYDPQRTALNQSFTQQNILANRQAAAMGRSVDDPILQAKLRTNQINQEALLNSQQGSYAGQLALQVPGQRVGYASQRSDVLGQLASQAFSNRNALLSLGSGIAGAERNFRLGTATRTNTSGGGVADAISGALAGLGTGMQFGAGFKGFNAPSMGFGGQGGGGIPASPFSALPSDFGAQFGQSAPGYGGGRSYSLGGR